MQRIKNSDEPVLTFGLQYGMSLTPDVVATFLTNFFANKTIGILTNVPGPTGEMTFAGVPATQVIGFAPCSGDQPMTTTIFSYNGMVTVGFATDAGSSPTPTPSWAWSSTRSPPCRFSLPTGTARGRDRAATSRPYSKRAGSPAPRLTITGSGPDRSTTVVGSIPHSPESTTASTTWSSRSLMSQPIVGGSSSPGSSRVLETSGLAELGKQRLHHGVTRDTHADGLLLGMLQPLAEPLASPGG